MIDKKKSKKRKKKVKEKKISKEKEASKPENKMCTRNLIFLRHASNLQNILKH